MQNAINAVSEKSVGIAAFQVNIRSIGLQRADNNRF